MWDPIEKLLILERASCLLSWTFVCLLTRLDTHELLFLLCYNKGQAVKVNHAGAGFDFVIIKFQNNT